MEERRGYVGKGGKRKETARERCEQGAQGVGSKRRWVGEVCGRGRGERVCEEEEGRARCGRAEQVRQSRGASVDVAL